MYALIDAFERDVRALLRRYVESQLDGDLAVFGSALPDLIARRDADSAGHKADLVEYMDLRPAYDLLNRHRKYLPRDLGEQVRELTSELDVITPIRHRVMHSRPLALGDFERIISSLSKFDFSFWQGTAKVLDHLRRNDAWVPEDNFEPLEDKFHHNLPQSEYNETGLVGRDEEVKSICRTLKRGRDAVITLCGEGGIGKTALALEIAYQLLDDPDEPFDLILWSSLKTERLTGHGVQSLKNSVADLVGIANDLGAGAQVDFAGGITELGAILDGFKPLIIIDNLETINGSDFVELYEALPDNASFLVTSREGIGQIERRVTVAPLSQRDATVLLNELIKARNVPGLQKISGDTRSQIVQKLRCSPLAIRWFILSTEAGRNPLDVINHQDELLSYCVKSVYDNLSTNAVEVFIAMEVLRRPVTPDDLVLLLAKSVSEVGTALRELVRGSLVRSRLSGDSAMVTIIELTETARQYSGVVIPRGHEVRRLVQENETTFMRDEERRQAETSRRQLGPNVVRTRYETDAPSAQILRRALSASRNQDFDGAFTLIEEAKQLNPDFWEVHRVEGFMRAASGDKLGARESYLSAHELAETKDHKAVVAYYFAGLLARNLMEPAVAVPYAREAHSELRLPDTATSLGTALVWSNQYDEGIELLEEAVVSAEGRMRLIAKTALADAYLRRGAWALKESRNPVQGSYDAICAFDLASDELNNGSADIKLRDAACEAARDALRYLMSCQQNGNEVDTMGDFFDKLINRVGQLTRADGWSAFRRSADALAASGKSPYAASQLRSAIVKALQMSVDGTSSVDDSGDPLEPMFGVIHALRGGFGFIESPALPNRLYFHKTGLEHGVSFSRLEEGMPVSFVETTDSDGRPRAEQVELR